MSEGAAIRLDAEARAEARDTHADLRLWLRLLTCTTLVETEIRRRLRETFDVTLPRFDLMAQLDRVPDGMTLGELSRRMMVSNGNVTGLVDRLVAEGLVTRTPAAHDRRVQIVSLTPGGRRAFRRMAAGHETWIEDLFGDLDPGERETLMRLLARLKASVASAVEQGGTP